jgi:corrinoid protein of di/trimethylamine methyltransferase
METKEILTNMSEALVDLDRDRVLDLIDQGLGAGLRPMEIIEEGLLPGMNTVGDEFEQDIKFLPEMMRSATIFQEAMTVLKPKIEEQGEAGRHLGTVVLGTVKGDLHSIGKDIVKILLETSGFTVHDLGMDVSTFTFIDKAEEVGADIIAMSALLTTTLVSQRDLIEALEEQGKRDQFKIMVGGGAVTQSWADEIKADCYSETGFAAAKAAQRLVG